LLDGAIIRDIASHLNIYYKCIKTCSK
jgi:hypothetical protein